ncbi:MAG: hypothetical protein NC116_12240 [Clostridium sp.]|nr:hypothetical protein [Clostridium sp.]
MSVLTAAEINRKISELQPETSDKLLEIMGDIKDSVSGSAQEIQDLKNQLEAKENEWREKFKSRFLDGEPVKVVEPDMPSEASEKPLTYEDLFKIE